MRFLSYLVLLCYLVAVRCASIEDVHSRLPLNDFNRVHSQLQHFFHQLEGKFDSPSHSHHTTGSSSSFPHTSFHQLTPQQMVDDIVSFANAVDKCYDVIGRTLTVLKNGQVFLRAPLGYRDREKQRPVTENTMFGIGSTSKAFTTALIAMFVDEGLLEWDKPITQYPQFSNFSLYDDFATKRVTLRDLCSHRVGLPRNDVLIGLKLNITRDHLISVLRYLPPDQDFRSSFEYNNLMFTLAGEVAARVAGYSDWEAAVKDRIFNRLNMTTTFVTMADTIATGNVAIPYANYQGQWVPLDPSINDAFELVCPAGCIHSNVLDMEKWLQAQIELGSPLFSKNNWLTIHSAQNGLRVPDTAQYFSPNYPFSYFFDSYGLAWIHGSYQGNVYSWHNGGIIGHTTLVYFEPYSKFGLFTSRTGGALPDSSGDATVIDLLIAWYASDITSGKVPWLTSDLACSFKPAKMESNPPSSSSSPSTSSAKATGWQDYLGTYEHPAYGRLSVSPGVVAPNYLLNYAQLSATLVESSPNTFSLQPQPPYNFVFGTPSIDDAVIFDLFGDQVVSLTIPFFEPNKHPTFIKV